MAPYYRRPALSQDSSAAPNCRATRPAWRNEHFDRLEREREARRVALEYRLEQRADSQSGPSDKRCTKCLKTLPIESFTLLRAGVKSGQRKARCKSCLKADGRAAYHAKRAADPDLSGKASRAAPPIATPGRKHCNGCDQTLPLSRFYILTTGQRKGTPKARCKSCASHQARASYTPRTMASDARQRAVAARVDRLNALLTGAASGRRIDTQEEWEMTLSELRELWLRSGDKICTGCNAAVPARNMPLPGPGNFYPGKCQTCAFGEYRESLIRAGCRLTDGPPLVRLRDGSAITVGELAARQRDRSSRYRIPRWAERPNLSAT